MNEKLKNNKKLYIIIGIMACLVLIIGFVLLSKSNTGKKETLTCTAVVGADKNYIINGTYVIDSLDNKIVSYHTKHNYMYSLVIPEDKKSDLNNYLKNEYQKEYGNSIKNLNSTIEKNQVEIDFNLNMEAAENLSSDVLNTLLLDKNFDLTEFREKIAKLKGNCY